MRAVHILSGATFETLARRIRMSADRPAADDRHAAEDRLARRLGGLVETIGQVPGTDFGLLATGQSATGQPVGGYRVRLVAVPPGPEQQLLRSLRLWDRRADAMRAVCDGGPDGRGGTARGCVRSVGTLGPDRCVLASSDGRLAAFLERVPAAGYDQRRPLKICLDAIIRILAQSHPHTRTVTPR
jgi:hypothetical protein